MRAQRPAAWDSLLREAGIAAEALYSGLNALRRANYTQQSLYNHGFFGITIGLERMAKISLLLESRIWGDGTYPTSTEFRRRYGHNLIALFNEVERIRLATTDQFKWKLPPAPVFQVAIDILSEFAQSTRYYNLDSLTGHPQQGQRLDPVDRWYSEVGEWILANRYTPRRASSDHDYALAAQHGLSIAFVMHTSEDGTTIDSVYDAALRGRQAEIIQREGTVICACLARHFAELISVLVDEARSHHLDEVPDIDEFFYALLQDESRFRKVKTFQI